MKIIYVNSGVKYFLKEDHRWYLVGSFMDGVI